MKYFKISLLLFVIGISCAASVPEKPTDVIITPGLNPLTDLWGYQLSFFTATGLDSTQLRTAVKTDSGGLIWLNFTPPTRFAETGVDSTELEKAAISFYTGNDKVEYDTTGADYKAVFKTMIFANPGYYWARLMAISKHTKWSGMSEGILIEVR